MSALHPGLLQEIEAVLQADKDDVQPFDDAPNYQVGIEWHRYS